MSSKAYKDSAQFDDYVQKNFQDVTDIVKKEHVVKDCPHCDIKLGFKIVAKDQAYTTIFDGAMRMSVGGRVVKIEYSYPKTLEIICPECGHYSVWVVYEIKKNNVARMYRLISLPAETDSEIAELPEKPESLRKAYSEAAKNLEINNPMSAAVMFRRALQIITRDILGAKPNSLALELKEIAVSNKLQIKLSQDFRESSYIIKEMANQSAHPDRDLDLLDLTFEDADELHRIFLEVVAEVFVIPAAREQSRKKLLDRRKIEIKKIKDV